ncbi:hypothetical protein C5470_22380, partial [Photorhabdus stackebrandtii]|nr:hypothetical protein [Photorhabdus stackebrandtii]
AVYASPSKLPRTAQDSLSGGTGYAFRSRTFTCKINAAFHSARSNGTISTDKWLNRMANIHKIK